MVRVNFEAKYQPMASLESARRAWEAEYIRKAGNSDQKVFMITGTIIPIWSDINKVFVHYNNAHGRNDPGFSQNKEILRVARATLHIHSALNYLDDEKSDENTINLLEEEASGVEDDIEIDPNKMKEGDICYDIEKIIGLKIPTYLVDSVKLELREVMEKQKQSESEKQAAKAATGISSSSAAAAASTTLSSIKLLNDKK